MPSDPPNRWLLLALGLAGRPGSTVRVRLWRGVRELGVATLRDGLSLLPATLEHRSAFEALAREAQTQGGTAWVLELPAQSPAVEEALLGLFDRGPAYGGLIETLARLDRELAGIEEPAARRALRQAQRSLAEIERIDFFPGPQRERARGVLAALVAEIDRRFSPAEPKATDAAPFTGPFDAFAVLLAVAAFLALYRYKIDIMKVIGASALVGLAYSLLT